jgi:hypothetical protein
VLNAEIGISNAAEHLIVAGDLRRPGEVILELVEPALRRFAFELNAPWAETDIVGGAVQRLADAAAVNNNATANLEAVSLVFRLDEEPVPEAHEYWRRRRRGVRVNLVVGGDAVGGVGDIGGLMRLLLRVACFLSQLRDFQLELAQPRFNGGVVGARERRRQRRAERDGRDDQ